MSTDRSLQPHEFVVMVRQPRGRFAQIAESLPVSEEARQAWLDSLAPVVGPKLPYMPYYRVSDYSTVLTNAMAQLVRASEGAITAKKCKAIVNQVVGVLAINHHTHPAPSPDQKPKEAELKAERGVLQAILTSPAAINAMLQSEATRGNEPSAEVGL